MSGRDIVNIAATLSFTVGLWGGVFELIPGWLSVILVIPATIMWAAGRFKS